jgi:hypothetical protein
MHLPLFEVLDCDLAKNIAVLSIRDRKTHLPRRHVCKFTFLMRVLSRYMIEQGSVAEDVRLIKQVLSMDKTRHHKLARSWSCLLKKQFDANTDYRRRVDGICACNDKAATDIVRLSNLAEACNTDCSAVKETCRVNNNSICSILDRLDRIEAALDIRPGRARQLPAVASYRPRSHDYRPRHEDGPIVHEDRHGYRW